MQAALVVMHLHGSAFWIKVQYLELNRCRLLLKSISIFEAGRPWFHE
jgi:H+/gluconate symporter-like permease